MSDYSSIPQAQTASSTPATSWQPQPLALSEMTSALEQAKARLSDALTNAGDADVVSGLSAAVAAVDFALRRVVQIPHRDPEEALAADMTHAMADRHALADTRDLMAQERDSAGDARDEGRGPAAGDRMAGSRDRVASASDRAAEAADLQAPTEAGTGADARRDNPDNPVLISDPLGRSHLPRRRTQDPVWDVEYVAELRRTIQELTTFLALEVRRAEDAERRLAEATAT